eukprot:633804-Prorocentrum_minimum.AAC.1
MHPDPLSTPSRPPLDPLRAPSQPPLSRTGASAGARYASSDGTLPPLRCRGSRLLSHLRSTRGSSGGPERV